jgi:serine/threonine protein phosphatase PrpC
MLLLMILLFYENIKDLHALDAVASGDDRSGTTAVVGIITPARILVSNCGDSRSVLGRGGGVAVPMSFDHKPNNEAVRLYLFRGVVCMKTIIDCFV